MTKVNNTTITNENISKDLNIYYDNDVKKLNIPNKLPIAKRKSQLETINETDNQDSSGSGDMGS